MFKKTFAVAGSLAAAVLAFSPLAQAGPLSSITFSVTAWNANTPGSNINSLNQQALPSNPLMNLSPFVTGTATGLPSWYVGSGTANTFGNFVGGNGPGSGTSNNFTFQNGGSFGTTLSTGSFGSATLMRLTFTLANNDTMMTIVHDDGISIFGAMGQVTPTTPGNSAYPTTATGTGYDLSAGTYSLYYVEANGAPSELSFQNVTEAPEPGALALFGAGLLGCALFIGRRRRMSRSI